MTIAQDGSLLLPTGGCLHKFDPVNRQVRWTYAYGGYNWGTPLVSSDRNIYWGSGWSFASISPQGGTNWIAQLDPNFVFGSNVTFGTDGNLYFVHDGLWSLTPASRAVLYVCKDIISQDNLVANLLLRRRR